MFSSYKLMTSIQSVGAILSLIGLISCEKVLRGEYRDVVVENADVIQAKPALEEVVCADRNYALEQSKFGRTIEKLTLSEVMALVREGEDKSYVGIEIDNSIIFRQASDLAKSMKFDSIPQPSQEETDLAESVFVNGLRQAGVVVDQFFAEFENSEKTGPYAKKITEVLEALKSEGFVDTVNLSEFFKQAFFKYLNGSLAFVAALPESNQEYFRSFYADSLCVASPQVTDDVQADPELESFNSYMRSVVLQLNSLGPKFSNFTDKDMPEIVKSFYEIEKALKAAIEWVMARKMACESDFLCIFSGLSDAQKDLLFETQRAAAISLSMLVMVYESAKVEYIPDYKESLGMCNSLTDFLCHSLLSIPFGRESMIAFNDSHVAQLPSPLAD